MCVRGCVRVYVCVCVRVCVCVYRIVSDVTSAEYQVSTRMLLALLLSECLKCKEKEQRAYSKLVMESLFQFLCEEECFTELSPEHMPQPTWSLCDVRDQSDSTCKHVALALSTSASVFAAGKEPNQVKACCCIIETARTALTSDCPAVRAWISSIIRRFSKLVDHGAKVRFTNDILKHGRILDGAKRARRLSRDFKTRAVLDPKCQWGQVAGITDRSCNERWQGEALHLYHEAIKQAISKKRSLCVQFDASRLGSPAEERLIISFQQKNEQGKWVGGWLAPQTPKSNVE